MARYILGIDTVYHSSGVGLIDENGKVIINEKKDIDFTNENAQEFYNFLIKNTLSSIKPILDEYAEDIFLISVSCEEGMFHSMPVGAVIANSISYFFDKQIVGVSHGTAHMHANWLDRKDEDIKFPVVCLNISGGHSDIYLLRSHCDIEKMADIFWTEKQDRFGGLGALFYEVCYLMNMKVKKGQGGQLLESLARLGEPRYAKELGDIEMKKEEKNYFFRNIKLHILEKLKSLQYYSLDMNSEKAEILRRDFASSFLQVLFNFLVLAVAQAAKESGSKEIHLAGGAAVNDLLKLKIENYCKESGLNFKVPMEKEYCGDNGSMAAISGYFKWKYSHFDLEEKFLTIKPTSWYYKYYASHYDK